MIGDEDAYLRLEYPRIDVEDCIEEVELLTLTNQLKAPIETVEIDLLDPTDGLDVEIVDVPETPIDVGESGTVTARVRCENEDEGSVGFEIDVDGDDLAVEAHRTDADAVEVDCNCPVLALKGISFVAFCGNGIEEGDVEISAIQAVDDDWNPVKVEWKSNVDVDEVVVKAGTEWYRFDYHGGARGGTVSSDEEDADAFKEVVGNAQTFVFDDEGDSDDDEEYDGPERSPSSPCLDQEGVKIDADDDEFGLPD